MTLAAILPGVPPVIVAGENSIEAARQAAASEASADRSETAADRAEALSLLQGYYSTVAAGAAATVAPNTFVSDEGGALKLYDADGNEIFEPVSRGGNPGIGSVWTAETAQTSAYSNTHNLAEPTVAFTNSAGGDDGVNARWLVNVGKFTNGPTGHATYFDTVAAWGLNLSNSYTPQNTSIAAASYRIESKFAQGGPSDPFASEFHTSINSADASSVECRPVSIFAPHLKADWAVSLGVSLRGGQISFMDGSISPDVAGTERIKFDFRPGNNSINIGKNGSERAPGISWNSNGVYVCRQINAAGNAFVPLPYVDASDGHYLEAAQSVVGTVRTDPTFALRSLFTEFGLSPAAGDTFRFATINGNITGNYTANRFDANVSGDLKWEVNNTGAGKTVLDLTSSTGTVEYRAQGVKVVGGQGAAVADAVAAAGAPTQAEFDALVGVVNTILARMRAHGLIAT